jgi:hypothetical protein
MIAADKAQGKALQTVTNGKLLQRKCIGGAFLTRKNYLWIKENIARDEQSLIYQPKTLRCKQYALFHEASLSEF